MSLSSASESSTITIDLSSNFTIDVSINNVVCSFSTKCYLNLRRIAMEGLHVEYKKENGMVNMKLRKPHTTASIWSSGKVTIAGAKSELEAYKAARRYCRLLQKMQFKVRMSNYRVVNVLASCTVPFSINIVKLADKFQRDCSYEPELHPGATFKLKELKTSLKLFTTGSITLTAPSVNAAKQALLKIYPILVEYKRVNTSTPTETVARVENENDSFKTDVLKATTNNNNNNNNNSINNFNSNYNSSTSSTTPFAGSFLTPSIPASTTSSYQTNNSSYNAAFDIFNSNLDTNYASFIQQQQPQHQQQQNASSYYYLYDSNLLLDNPASAAGLTPYKTNCDDDFSYPKLYIIRK